MTKRLYLSAASLSIMLGISSLAYGGLLGTAGDYAVLAGSSVTNTGSSTLSGSLGVWPGSSATGFPPGLVTNGSIHLGDAEAQQAQSDLTAAYHSILNESFTQDLTGTDLGGLTLTPGVYFFSSSAFLTGALTLDGRGDPNARFDFQIGSTLVTASDARVDVINGGSCNVFWQVGSSATLGSGTAFAGHILALTSISLGTNSSITNGSALARNGSVSLQSNSIAICPQAVPEPITLVPFALCALGVLRRSKRTGRRA